MPSLLPIYILLIADDMVEKLRNCFARAPMRTFSYFDGPSATTQSSVTVLAFEGSRFKTYIRGVEADDRLHGADTKVCTEASARVVLDVVREAFLQDKFRGLGSIHGTHLGWREDKDDDGRVFHGEYRTLLWTKAADGHVDEVDADLFIQFVGTGSSSYGSLGLGLAEIGLISDLRTWDEAHQRLPMASGEVLQGGYVNALKDRGNTVFFEQLDQYWDYFYPALNRTGQAPRLFFPPLPPLPSSFSSLGPP